MQEASERDLSTKCKVCTKTFARKNRKGTYCSVQCRKKAFHQRRHNFAALFNQIVTEFKKVTSQSNQKEIYYKKIDTLVGEWKKQFGKLADEFNASLKDRGEQQENRTEHDNESRGTESELFPTV